MKPWESVKEIHIFCGRLDLKHLIDLSKMKLFNNVFTSPIRILQCCISQAMRSASVRNCFTIMESIQVAVLVLILFLVN